MTGLRLQDSVIPLHEVLSIEMLRVIMTSWLHQSLQSFGFVLLASPLDSATKGVQGAIVDETKNAFNRIMRIISKNLRNVKIWTDDIAVLDPFSIERKIREEFGIGSRNVFLSFANQDDDDAGYITRQLERIGLRVYKAPRSIQPGSKWGESIRLALNSAPEMCVIWTKHASESEWVKLEAGSFWAQNKIVTPLLAEGTSEADLPGFLQIYQAIKFPQDFEIYKQKILERRTAMSASKGSFSP